MGDLIGIVAASGREDGRAGHARKLGVERVVSLVNLTGKPVKAAVKGADAAKPLLAEGAEGDPQGVITLAAHGYWIGKK